MDPINDAEDVLLESVKNFKEGDGATLSLVFDDTPESIQKKIRGSFLRYIILHYKGECPASILSIENIAFAGEIDLAGSDVPIGLVLRKCMVKQISLVDAKVMRLHLIASTVGDVLADRASLAGTLSTNSGAVGRTTISGEFRLGGARLGGNLDLRRTSFTGWLRGFGEARLALLADGVEVGGSVLLGDETEAGGELRLNGCKVERDFEAGGLIVRNGGGYGLSVAGAHIKGHLRCFTRRSSDGAMLKLESDGTLRLSGTRIGGNLDLSEAKCTSSTWNGQNNAPHRSDFSIEATGLSIVGDLRLSNLIGLGCVDFTNLDLDGDLECEAARFEMPGLHALILEGAEIDGAAWFKGVWTDGILRLVHTTFKSRLVVTRLKLERPRSSEIRQYSETGIKGWRATEEKQDGRLKSKLRQSYGQKIYREACGLNLNRAVVEGTFKLSFCDKRDDEPTPEDAGHRWLSVHGCHVGEFDDEDAWIHVDRINPSESTFHLERVALEGFHYGRLYRPIYDPPQSKSLRFLKFWLRVMSELIRPKGSALVNHSLTRLDVIDREYAPLNHADYSHYILPELRRRRWPKEKSAYPVALRGSRFGKNQSIKDRASVAFSPHPYVVLAGRLRQDGFTKDAERVLRRLALNRERYERLPIHSRIISISYRLIFGYGYSWGRFLILLVLWILASAFVYDQGYVTHHIRAAPSNHVICLDPPGSAYWTQKDSPEKASTDKGLPPQATPCHELSADIRFNPILYAIDSVVPIVDLNQRKNWFIEKYDGLLDKDHYLHNLFHSLVFNLLSAFSFSSVVLGWVVSALFFTGLTGLKKRND